MLLWQQNRRKSYLFVGVLCFISIAHFLCCFFIFIVGGASQVVHLKLCSAQRLQGRTIVIVPMSTQKRVQGLAIVSRGKSISVRKSHKKSSFKKTQSKVQTSIQKTIEPKKKEPIVNKNNAKKSSKKSIKKEKIISAKRDLKKDEKKVVEKKQNIQSDKKEDAPEEKHLEKVVEKIDESQAGDDGIISVSLAMDTSITQMNRQEYEAYLIQEQIYQEIVRCWHPPSGLDPKLECRITFFVGQQGTVEHYTMTKSSGSLAFDISARAALKKSVFPRSHFGRTIDLTFNQDQS